MERPSEKEIIEMVIERYGLVATKNPCKNKKFDPVVMALQMAYRNGWLSGKRDNTSQEMLDEICDSALIREDQKESNEC